MRKTISTRQCWQIISMRIVSSLLLVTKHDHAQAAALAVTMQTWLAEHHVRAKILTHPARQDGCAAILREAAQGVDAVVVLGGDGTFIGVARHLSGQPVGQKVPFLGINFGHLGFLTETPAKDWRPVLRQMLAGKLRRVPRLVLRWTLERDGKLMLEGNAINDVVVSRGNLARVADIHLSVGRKPVVSSSGLPGVSEDLIDFSRGELGWIRADGIIVASPIGSSAYSLSARGPLVHPALSNLLITAVAPFQNSVPPLVLPGDSCIRLQCATDDMAGAEICLTVDGQEGHILGSGDAVYISGLPDGLDVLVRHPDNYLQALQRRGFIRRFMFANPRDTGMAVQPERRKA